MHAAGLTDEAQRDMARLALIRKQREEASKRREAEKQGRCFCLNLSLFSVCLSLSLPPSLLPSLPPSSLQTLPSFLILSLLSVSLFLSLPPHSNPSLPYSLCNPFLSLLAIFPSLPLSLPPSLPPSINFPPSSFSLSLTPFSLDLLPLPPPLSRRSQKEGRSQEMNIPCSPCLFAGFVD